MVKYEIIIYLNVYDLMGNFVMFGNKIVVEIQFINYEVEVIEIFVEIVEFRQLIVKKFMLEMDEYGNVIDVMGQSVLIRVENIVEQCLIVFDYISIDVNCVGFLNIDIDNVVVNDVGFYVFILVVIKFEGVINFISLLNMELFLFKNFFIFRVKIEYVDGFVLVVDVMVKEGVVEIVLNKDVLRISENRMFI